MNNFSVLIFFILFIVIGCTKEPTTVISEPVITPYPQGKLYYDSYCANCHQENGKGLKKLYPAIDQDYLLKHRNELPCMIKHGMKGEIVIKGEVFNQEMPGNDRLSPIDITNILNYIFTAWENKVDPVHLDSVRVLLKECP